MQSLTVSLITLVVLFGITFIVLFGDLPNFKNSFVNRLRQRLVSIYENLITGARHLDQVYCNGILYKVFVQWLHPCYKWILPLFYIVLFTILVIQFFQHSYLRLGNARLFLIVASLFINISSFILGIITNPGELTKINAKYVKDFPYNELIFSDHSRYNNLDKNYCRTCNVLKFPRSKHCSTCNKCYILYDHHCIWLNNCVGYYNYKWFLIFLLSLIWVFIYGCHLTYPILAREIASLNHELNFFQKWYQVISNTTVDNERTGIIFLLCSSLPWLISWFTFEHLQFIYLGMTTNESAKWDFIRFLIDNGILYKFDDAIWLIEDTKGVYYRLSDEDVRFHIPRGQELKLKKIDDMANELENIYDLGFWDNLKQRMITKNYY